MNMAHYRIEVDVRDEFRPGMQRLVDAVCEFLERDCGCVEHDYYVEAHGPAELSIVLRQR